MVVNRRPGHGSLTVFHRSGVTTLPLLETYLGVRLRPQRVSKSCIEKSTPVRLMTGFPIPFGMTLKIGNAPFQLVLQCNPDDRLLY